MITHTKLKKDGYLVKNCPIYNGTKIGSSSCVHCRFFVNADDKGSPTRVDCYGWKPNDILNRDLIILIDSVIKTKRPITS